MGKRATDLPEKPKCFPRQEDWAAWWGLARQTAVPARSGYCIDCDPETKHRKRLAGLCEWPQVKFMDVAGDGEVVGLRVVPVRILNAAA